MKKLICLLLFGSCLLGCGNKLVWHISSPNQATCLWHGDWHNEYVVLEPSTKVRVYQHLDNGTSVVTVLEGAQVGRTVLCMTNRIYP
jgi:hypothetical protein